MDVAIFQLVYQRGLRRFNNNSELCCRQLEDPWCHRHDSKCGYLTLHAVQGKIHFFLSNLRNNRNPPLFFFTFEPTDNRRATRTPPPLALVTCGV